MAEHAAHLRPRPVAGLPAAGRDACTRIGQPSGYFVFALFASDQAPQYVMPSVVWYERTRT